MAAPDAEPDAGPASARGAIEHRPRCVFIGPGRWGRTLLPHVVSHFEIAAVVSRGSPASTAWSRERWPNLSHLTSLDEALGLPALDAAFIATPTPTHSHLARAALRAGCHVFVEKPLALRLADAVEVTDTALARHLELFIGYVYLFHPGVQLLRSLAPPSAIRSLRFHWIRPGLTASPRQELLCHELALAISLTDEVPDRCDVRQDDDRTFRAVLHLPSDRSCSILLRTPVRGPKLKTVAVRCHDGSTHVWSHDVVVTSQRGGATRTVRVAPEAALALEVAAFRAAVDGSGPRMIDDRRFCLAVTDLLARSEGGAGS